MATIYRPLKMIDRDLMEWWYQLDAMNWHEDKEKILEVIDVLLDERFVVQEQNRGIRNLKITSA